MVGAGGQSAGIEYNPDMVELKRVAAKGANNKASFAKADQPEMTSNGRDHRFVLEIQPACGLRSSIQTGHAHRVEFLPRGNGRTTKRRTSKAACRTAAHLWIVCYVEGTWQLPQGS